MRSRGSRHGQLAVLLLSGSLVAELGLVTSRVAAQGPLGLGRPATAEEIRARDTTVGPDGKGLPPGGGTAAAGKLVYDSRCVTCHGATGKEGPQDVLVGGQGTLTSAKPVKTIGSYWPYATTVWDYIHRAMPFDRPGSLSTDQVYAVTAYLLFLNGIVGEQEVLDAATLPKVQMPNRGGFVTDPRPDTGNVADPTAPKPAAHPVTTSR